jgi:hypothetical protein
MPRQDHFNNLAGPRQPQEVWLHGYSACLRGSAKDLGPFEQAMVFDACCVLQAYESMQQQVLKGSALSVASFHPEAISSSFASESEPQARRGRCSQSRWQTRFQETLHLLQKQPQSKRRKRSKQCPDPNHSKSDCGKPFLHQKAKPGAHPLQPE